MIAMAFFLFWMFIAALAMHVWQVALPLMFIYVVWTRGWVLRCMSILTLVLLIKPDVCAMVMSVWFVIALFINQPVAAGATAAPGIASYIRRFLDK